MNRYLSYSFNIVSDESIRRSKDVRIKQFIYYTARIYVLTVNVQYNDTHSFSIYFQLVSRYPSMINVSCVVMSIIFYQDVRQRR